ncbi:hypothetical protein INR49_032162 [Caranx melampygus]|nr:hypothetical protein INR49_032162 [Caranx melampygus]
MSMKAGGNRSKPGGGNAAGAPASGAGGSGGGRQNLGRGRHSGKGPAAGTKCELKVKNGAVYEGVFKTYGPECDLVLDAAHRKSPEPSIGPRREDIVESIIFKASDVVVVTFKDVDLNFARKVGPMSGCEWVCLVNQHYLHKDLCCESLWQKLLRHERFPA